MTRCLLAGLVFRRSPVSLSLLCLSVLLAPCCNAGPLTVQGYYQIKNAILSDQVGGKVGYMESGLLLDIAPNRPNLDAVINAGIQAASALGATEVGLYVGGVQHPKSDNYPVT